MYKILIFIILLLIQNKAFAYEEILTQLQINKVTLPDYIEGIREENKIYLNAVELFQVVQGLKEDNSKEIIGTFFEYGNFLVINKSNSSISYKQNYNYSGQDKLIFWQGNYYISIDFLSQITNFKYKYHEDMNSLVITTDRDLFFVERLKRKYKAHASEALPACKNFYDLEPVNNYSYPSFYFKNSNYWNKGSGSENNQSPFSTFTNLYLTNKTGRIKNDLTIYYDSQQNANLIYYTGTTKLNSEISKHPVIVEGGDVSSSGGALSTNIQGRGAKVTNLIEDSVNINDTATLTGILPNGWQIELYRDNVLIAFQETADNMYNFTNLSLLEGSNDFIIKMYGPGGEYEEKKETLNRLPKNKGDFTFNITANQDAPLFNNINNSNNSSPIVSALNTSFSYGLNDKNAIIVETGHIGQINALGVGLSTNSIKNTSLVVEPVIYNSGNMNLLMNSSTQVGQTNFWSNIESGYLPSNTPENADVTAGPQLLSNSFTSDGAPGNPGSYSNSSFYKYQSIKSGIYSRLFRLPVAFSVYKMSSPSETQQGIEQSISWQISNYNFYHFLKYDKLLGNRIAYLTANLPRNSRIKFTYQPTGLQPSGLEVSKSFNINNKSSINLDYQRIFSNQSYGNTSDNVYTLNYNHKFKNFNLILSAQKSSNESTIMLGFDCSGLINSDKKMIITGERIDQENIFTHKRYIDTNLNGIMDEDEKLIQENIEAQIKISLL
jgi:hypothetical protein